jgi:uncharacterized integral membrane protein
MDSKPEGGSSSSRRRDWGAGGTPVESDAESRRIRWQIVVGAVVALALILLIAQNGDRTEIDWAFFDFESRLWVILLLAAVAGAMVWELIKRSVKKRRSRTAKNPRA